MVAINEKLMPDAGSPQNLPVGDYYLLRDTLYRVAALTNSSGNIVEAYGCDAYGNTLIFTAADSSGNWWGGSATQSNYGTNDIIFCGYRLDPETENYYVRNRFYSPTLGRWLTRDPIGYQGGVNLYEYVGGGAVSALDPDGQWHWYEPWTWPLFHGAPVKEVGNAAPYAEPGTDVAGPIAGAAEALMPLANWQVMEEQRRAYDACQSINRHTDPLYEGAKALANHQPLTPAEHAAIQKAIQSPWWLP